MKTIKPIQEMKFKIADFTNLPEYCSTIKTMLAWAKDRPFTMTELQAAFPETDNVGRQALQYMKPHIIKKYVQTYMDGRGHEVINTLEARAEKKEEYAQLVEQMKKYIDNPIEVLQHLESQAHSISTMQAKLERSAPVRIMVDFYNENKRDGAAQNGYLQDVLNSCIMAQFKFEEDDVKTIYKDCAGGYWFNVSTNGKSYGESFYNVACEYNTTFCISYEKFFERIPYIINNKRIFTGAKFKYDGKYYHVTGWNDNQELTVTGYDKPATGRYADDKDRGKRSNKKFTRYQWLDERDKMELITTYSIR